MKERERRGWARILQYQEISIFYDPNEREVYIRIRDGGRVIIEFLFLAISLLHSESNICFRDDFLIKYVLQYDCEIKSQ